MDGADILRVLADVAEQHASASSGGQLDVIPVLMTDVDPPVGLIEAVIEHLGGLVLDTTTGAFDRPISGRNDPLLRGQVQQALDLTISGLKVSLSFEADQIDASVERKGRLLARPTGGDKHLLAIARALNDARLDEHELAVLIYRETILDFEARTEVLSLLTGLPSTHRTAIGSVRTLVVAIASAGLDIGTHCRYPGGVRYSLESPRLIMRHPAGDLPLRARRLATRRTRPPVFFLAAGFSASSGMPVGNGIRDQTIRRLVRDAAAHAATSDELGHAFWKWAEPDDDLLLQHEREAGEDRFVELLTLEQVVRIESRFKSDPETQTLRDLKQRHDERLNSGQALGKAVYHLKEVIEQGRPLILATVNYDELVEHVAGDKLDIAVTPEDFHRITPILKSMRDGGVHPEGKIPYLKLHGTIGDLKTCVASDTVTRAGLPETTRDALRALIAVKEGSERLFWIYVGASMRDIDLEKDVLNAREFARGLVEETWVTPALDASVSQFLRRNPRDLVPDLFARSVTETADTFFQAFAREWSSY